MPADSSPTRTTLSFFTSRPMRVECHATIWNVGCKGDKCDPRHSQGARMLNRGQGIKLFSTGPQSIDHQPGEYLRKIADVTRWSEACGCEGILIYTDNRILDPWLVSQVVVENSERLAPLVAV